MSINHIFSGPRRPLWMVPADTNVLEEVFDIAQAMSILVDSVWISTKGNAAAVSIWINDGSDRIIFFEKAVSANTGQLIELGGFLIQNGHSIKVQTNQANETTFGFSLIEQG